MSLERSNEPNDISGGYDSMRLQRSEHVHLNNNGYKAVMAYGWNGTDPVPLMADTLADYGISDTDETSATIHYYGYLNAAGKWYITKESISSSVKSYRYVSGTTGYTTAWTARASQTYDYYDVIF